MKTELSLSTLSDEIVHDHEIIIGNLETVNCDEIIDDLERQYDDWMSVKDATDSSRLCLQSMIEWLKVYKNEAIRLLQ